MTWNTLPVRGFLLSLLSATLLPIFGGCVEGYELESTTQLIIEGEVTPAELFPATGALLDGDRLVCSGTLIAPTVVLSAAHCFEDDGNGITDPYFTLSLNGDEPDAATIVKGAAIHRYPSFDMTLIPEGLGRANDIALLILEEPILNVAYEVPLRQEEAELLQKDGDVAIVGYGISSLDYERSSAGQKKHGLNRLGETLDHEFDLDRIGKVTTCSGDSGGPALIDGPEGRRLVGIVSRGHDYDGCRGDGIATRVDPYFGWIVETAPSVCEILGCNPEDYPERPAPPPPKVDGPGAMEGGCNVSSRGSSSTLLWFLLLLAVFRRHGPTRPRQGKHHGGSL